DRNRSHWSTSKTPSYTKSVSWQHHPNGYLNIDVASPGTKIHEPEKLFRRFWRGDNSRHSVGQGLGLSLVKAIAELHGGSATYHYLNKHNVFRIMLPQRN
ncbi:ATP-binding protein, partial [Escherichia coli]|uniref:ATP-binding protein n=1 Tax=Escherichia coli TaxID=562 RepID=UPI001E42111D